LGGESKKKEMDGKFPPVSAEERRGSVTESHAGGKRDRDSAD